MSIRFVFTWMLCGCGVFVLALIFGFEAIPRILPNPGWVGALGIVWLLITIAPILWDVLRPQRQN